MTMYFLAGSALLLIALMTQRRRLMRSVIPALKQALLAQPDMIILRPASDPKWKRASLVEELSKALLSEGFRDAGVYGIDKMPGALVRIMTGPDSVAVVYDHPAVGAWTDIVSVYEDGAIFTVTTAPETGMPRPDWAPILRFSDAPAAKLHSELLRSRPQKGLRRISDEDAPRELEKAYFRHSVWMKQRDLSLSDVEKMAAECVKDGDLKTPYITAKRAQKRHARRQWKIAVAGLLTAGIMLAPAYALLVLGWRAYRLSDRGETAIAEVTAMRQRSHRKRRQYREIKYRFSPEGGEAVYTYKPLWGKEDSWAGLKHSAYEEAVRSRRVAVRYDPADPWNQDLVEAPGLGGITDSPWFFFLGAVPFIFVGLLALAMGGSALILSLLE